MLRTLCLIAPLLTAAPAVHAQVETLLQSDDWAVAQRIDQQANSTSCILISQPPGDRLFLFRLFITDRVPALEVSIVSDSGTPASGQTTLALSVDDIEPWQIPGVVENTAFTSLSRYNGVVRDLVDAMAQGRSLSASFPEMDWPAMTWDLTGAEAALDALDRCFSLAAAYAN